MKQEDCIYAFKNQLRNYQYYLKQIQYYREQVEDCFDKLGASPHSIDYSKIHTHTPMSKEVEHKLREYIEFYSKKQKLYEDMVTDIDSTLNKIPVEVRKMTTDMFILGETEIAVSERNFISPSGMRKQINKAIKKALDD